MPDLPDWYQGFQLVGSDITVNVNIEASDVTLPISIDAATVTLDVTITASEVDLNIVFTDQSVAVFDAGKWFALQAKQVFVKGSESVPDDGNAFILSRLVPDATTFFIVGMSYGANGDGAPNAMRGDVYLEGTRIITLGSYRGHGIIFDTPIRAPAGVTVWGRCGQFGSGGAMFIEQTIWGYDKED